jgi:hypothetical protein
MAELVINDRLEQKIKFIRPLPRRSEIALSREDSGQKIIPPALPSPRRRRAILLALVLPYGSFPPEIFEPIR